MTGGGRASRVAGVVLASWLAALALGGATVAAGAESPSVALGGATLTPHLSDRLRLEIVDWFDPGPAAAPGDDNTYTFLANVLHVGGTLAHERFTVFADAQHVTLIGIPDDAGALGPGATYYQNNRRDTPNELFLREAWLRVGDLGVPGLALHRGGRFKCDDGLEGLARVQAQRISQRLIGSFG